MFSQAAPTVKEHSQLLPIKTSPPQLMFCWLSELFLISPVSVRPGTELVEGDICVGCSEKARTAGGGLTRTMSL